MLRYVVIAVMLTLPSAPCFALTAQEKMETCTFGADEQKLEGAKRDAFLKKCMANKNDPRGPAGAKPKGQPKD
ncbi:MAG TPA: PsiF family protein [Xanthobacteraceae bacterium]|jgi:hypothetical protein|nr:PsiF family protein [Xanthobacteraceae bacterium]